MSVAVVYGVLLVVAAFFAPVYRWTSASSEGESASSESESASSAGELAQGSETLVGANGLGAVVVAAVPLMAALLVGSALRLGSRRRTVSLAWTATGLLAVFNLLAIASIGLFILPTTVALVVACAASPPRSHGTPGGSRGSPASSKP